jgi:Fuc2NAc and GlcNAc transferase
MSLLVATSAVALIVCVALVWWARAHALRRNILDVPNTRSSHAVPTPRGGGIAIVATYVGSSAWLFWVRALDAKLAAVLCATGCAIAAVGFFDDRSQLSARLRFSVHAGAAVVVIAALGGFPEPDMARWGMGNFWVAAAFSALVLVWGTNLFNFMDGIDGIAASEAVFILTSTALLNVASGGDYGMTAASLNLAAACVGFLLWNWPPARIFLGDVGSGFLGFMVTALVLVSCQRGRLPVEVLPILGGVFVVDATSTLVRRVLRGDRWFEAHRMHAYQHLARRFHGHRPVTLLVSGVNLLWLLPWAYVATRFPAIARLCFAAALLPLVIFALLAGAGKRERQSA